MSRHWNPDDELARSDGADGSPRPRKPGLPEGAAVGLALVAAGCLAIGLTLYQFAGPRDVVAENAAPE